ncbi:peptidoglycan bridge formation glycyltransferase FemA/FemB family protein [Patescibacteria group bacterium]|nr:peptidoglycan bridge formation glycyltransferase FemA/FemB family protein [Patescibacteria group bacterium]
MEISKENWNKFVLDNNGSFLQSWDWGEFQKNFGRRVFRFFVEKSAPNEAEGLSWVAQFIEIKLPLGKKYWYGPKAPLLAKNQQPIANSHLEEFIEKIKELAQKEGAMFFRIEPELSIEQLNNLGFKQLSYDIEPSQTLILDIIKSEDEILAQMHEKTRYNIHLAERKGVKVKMVSTGDADFEKYFEEFYRLTVKGTGARKEIRHHPKDYYKKQLTINSQQLKIELFVAEYESKVIAVNVLAIFGKTATYLHGATRGEHRDLMAPHLLQWEQIRYAKSQGCSEYDFWGIANQYTQDRRKSSWEGFTRFKKGFGGREVNYIGYWDYPLDKKWYLLYRLVQGIRR